MTQATPTKLRSGEWGARVCSAQVHEGDEIQITTRAGKTWAARVAKVVWTGDGVAIVATATSRQSQSRSGGTCDECGEHRSGLRHAVDSSGLSGMVCARCDGPSYELSFA